MKFLAFAAICTVTNLSSFVSANYYKKIDLKATDDKMLAQLNRLVWRKKKEVKYADVWDVFKETGKFLPGSASCKKGEISDIYSSNCWTPGKEVKVKG